MFASARRPTGRTRSAHPHVPRPRALAALDFGLRVRVEIDSPQLLIFDSAHDLPVRQFTSELAELVSELRVRSFAVRSELEHVTDALIRCVESGLWPQARRASHDLAGLLRSARTRRLVDPELSIRGANAARRIAEMCEAEVSR